MATRYHINPATGKPGVCNPEKTGVCRYGAHADHYASPEDAHKAYESTQDSFAVVVTKTAPDGRGREVNTFDASLSQRMSVAQQQFEDAPDKARWVEDKVVVLDKAQRALDQTLPGTAERSEALIGRISAREDLLAADLVAWRDSPVYNEAVEIRMRENVVNITDADNSIEDALADDAGKRAVASQYGLSERDVENILDVAHRDYLRPRAPMSSSINALAGNSSYAATTAHVFRVDPSAVRGVLAFAASRSTVPSRTSEADEFASFSW